MIDDKLAYITEAAAKLSPENQDRIILAIEQLLGYEHREHRANNGNMKELFEIQPDAH
jgi:hypothetical protein